MTFQSGSVSDFPSLKNVIEPVTTLGSSDEHGPDLFCLTAKHE
jgi:hypothetical protein